MKVSELRIGNYVLCDNQLRRVKEICSNGIVSLFGNEFNSCCRDLKPAPLTNEILCKLFEEKTSFLTRKEYIINDDSLIDQNPASFTAHIESNDKASLHIVIKHIHELQNALQICGIEVDFSKIEK
jgi:hypothetical protein